MALYLLLIPCFYVLSMHGIKGQAESNFVDFDCVDIYDQPAFQHPLLKNHKIQTKFSFDESHEEMRNSKISKGKRLCPTGMVPIQRRRNGTEDIIHPQTAAYPGQHFATVETMLDGSIYQGAEAEITIHNLTLQRNQYSKGQIWLENGPPNELNSIQFGVATHPRLYGDSFPRITIYWTADGYRKTGCYNMMCSGFVQLSPRKYIGSGFDHFSVYGKFSAYMILRVIHDGFTGNWALRFFDELIGYWPKELFTHLNKGASMVRYGGNTFVGTDGISPPMGNGHFAGYDDRKAAFFRNVKIMKANYQKINIEDRKIRRYVDSVGCYRVLYLGDFVRSEGVMFSYGGPGGRCDL